MITCRGVLVAFKLDVIQQMHIALEEDIRVEVQQLAVLGDVIDQIGEQP